MPTRHCQEIQKKILSTNDNTYASEILNHFEKCDICKDLANEWMALKNIDENYTVPEKLDNIIQNEALKFIEKNKKNKKKFILYPILATAASLMFIFSIMTPSNKNMNNINNNQITNVKNKIQWNDISMENDFLDLDIMIEVNDNLIHISQDANLELVASEINEIDVPELLEL